MFTELAAMLLQYWQSKVTTAGIRVLSYFHRYCEYYATLSTSLGDALLKILTNKLALTIFRAHAHNCNND